MVSKFLPLVLLLELKRRNSSRTRYLVTSRIHKEMENGEKVEGWKRFQILSWPRDFYIYPEGNAQGEPVGAKVYITKKIMGDKKPEFKSITTKQIVHFFFLFLFPQNENGYIQLETMVPQTWIYISFWKFCNKKKICFIMEFPTGCLLGPELLVWF